MDNLNGPCGRWDLRRVNEYVAFRSRRVRSAGVVNIKIARIARYFASYERPPPEYADEWAEFEQERRGNR